jgi:tripeptidyl-peptidase-1
MSPKRGVNTVSVGWPRKKRSLLTVLWRHTHLVMLLALFCGPVHLGTEVTPERVLPSNWKLLGRAPADEIQRIHVALKQPERGVEALRRALDEVSDPLSASYTQWLSKDQVEALVRPNEGDFKRVETWASSCGVQQMQRAGGDAIVVTASISALECMLEAPLSHVRNPSGRTLVRALAPLRVPLDIGDVVELLSPLGDFRTSGRDLVRRTTRSIAADADGHVGVVPQTLAKLYGGATSAVRAGSNISQAVAELQHALGPEGFDESDLGEFQSAMLLSSSVKPTLVTGGHNDGVDPTGECTLDVDYIGAVAQGAATTFWMSDEWVYELALAISNATNPPDVVSISWGYTEVEQCGPTEFGPDMPANCTLIGVQSNATYVARANTEFLKLSARGVSLLAASGDSGAPGERNSDCERDGTPEAALNPDFPAASPYVLSVGATMLVEPSLLDPTASATPAPCRKQIFSRGVPCASGGTEVVAAANGSSGGARITSGGGFSRLSAMPKWQAQAVGGYLKTAKGLPPASTFNSSNRAYPDVAALGKDYLMFMKGTGSKGWNFFDGTSAATPTWAGLVSLLNDARSAVGKKNLGYLPPMLYNFAASAKAGHGLSDVVTGNNRCTRASSSGTTSRGGVHYGVGSNCCKFGFEAAAGWDPVTGLGTPRFESLKEYVLSLP